MKAMDLAEAQARLADASDKGAPAAGAEIDSHMERAGRPGLVSVAQGWPP
jgi:hypothetical protein